MARQKRQSNQITATIAHQIQFGVALTTKHAGSRSRPGVRACLPGIGPLSKDRRGQHTVKITTCVDYCINTPGSNKVVRNFKAAVRKNQRRRAAQAFFTESFWIQKAHLSRPEIQLDAIVPQTIYTQNPGERWTGIVQQFEIKRQHLLA